MGSDVSCNDHTVSQPDDEEIEEIDEWVCQAPAEYINARVVRVEAGGVWLDIGAKFESFLPGTCPHEIGDKVCVYVQDDPYDHDRPLQVSYIRRNPIASRIRSFLDSAKPGDVHQGQIIKRVQGGFIVHIGFINLFLPDEHIPATMLADTDAMIGQSGDWRITEVDREWHNIRVAPA